LLLPLGSRQTATCQPSRHRSSIEVGGLSAHWAKRRAIGIKFLGGAGLFFVIGAAMSRLQRRQERGAELARLQGDIRAAKFWGYDAESEENAYRKKIAEQDRWSNNIKFEIGNWAAMAVGVVLWLMAAAVWSSEDSTHTANQLWDLTSKFAAFAFAGGLLVSQVYRLLKRIDRADSEIEWLNNTLRALSSNYQGWASTTTERLERLEGKGSRR
jgi:hypothetical protein